MIGAKPDEALWDFMFYLFGFGGDILDKDNKVIINNEAGVTALTFYADLLKDKVVPPDVNTYGYNEILTTLQEGKAAMGIQWMAATQTLTRLHPRAPRSAKTASRCCSTPFRPAKSKPMARSSAPPAAASGVGSSRPAPRTRKLPISSSSG